MKAFTSRAAGVDDRRGRPGSPPRATSSHWRRKACLTLGPPELQRHGSLRAELQLGVAVGSTVHAGIDQGVVLEAQAQSLREGPHGLHLVLVPGEGHGLEDEGNASRAQAFDPRQALVVGAPHLRHALVGRAGHAVQADLHRVGPVLREEVRDRFGHQCAVGEDRDAEPLPDRVEVDLRKVGAQQRLAPGDQQVQAAGLDDLVHDAPLLREAQLALAGGAVPGRLVHVAVDAGEVAAERGLEGPLDGNPPLLGVQLLQELGEAELGERRTHLALSSRS